MFVPRTVVVVAVAAPVCFGLILGVFLVLAILILIVVLVIVVVVTGRAFDGHDRGREYGDELGQPPARTLSHPRPEHLHNLALLLPLVPQPRRRQALQPLYHELRMAELRLVVPAASPPSTVAVPPPAHSAAAAAVVVVVVALDGSLGGGPEPGVDAVLAVGLGEPRHEPLDALHHLDQHLQGDRLLHACFPMYVDSIRWHYFGIRGWWSKTDMTNYFICANLCD